MRIQYVSDLHLDRPENKREFLRRFKVTGDILVIAGDFATLNTLSKYDDIIDLLSSSYKHVVIVPGNHDFYSSHQFEVDKPINIELRKNVQVCNLQSIEVEGIKLVCATLWSNIKPNQRITAQIFGNDYRYITYKNRMLTSNDACELHKLHVDFLKKNITSDSIVVTHHSPVVYGPRSQLSSCFMTNLGRLPRPKAWIFGHTHVPYADSDNYVSNPLGYMYEFETYNPEAVFTI